MAFHVGQKIVCVDAFSCPLADGAIYTVAKIHPHYWKRHEGAPARDNRDCDGIEVAETNFGLPFYSERFRPVVERKTDIAIFTALLNPINHKHLEGV